MQSIFRKHRIPQAAFVLLIHLKRRVVQNVKNTFGFTKAYVVFKSGHTVTLSKNSSSDANALDLKHSAKSPSKQAALVFARYGSVSGPVPSPIQSNRFRPISEKLIISGY